jgi:hypothetical protein
MRVNKHATVQRDGDFVASVAGSFIGQIVILKQLCHVYFKKWDNESNFAFFNPKKV